MENKDKEKKEKDQKENKENNEIKQKFTPEDLLNFIEEIKEKYDIDDENIRIVRIERRKPSLKQTILSFLFAYFLDFALIIALNGYIGFAPYDIFRLLVFSLIFTTTEILVREMMMKYYPKLMFYSFGTIVIPISIAVLIFSWWVTPKLEFTSFNKLVIFYIVFLILRVVINFLSMKMYRDKMFRKIKGGK